MSDETPKEPGTESVAESPAEVPPTPPEAPAGSVMDQNPLPETAQEIPATAHSAQNEPLAPESEPIPPPVVSAPVSQPLPALNPADGRAARTARKQKNLDRILGLFTAQTEITNDEVEKLLHVSDATATRYLSQLEKEGKIVQVGTTGQSVSYRKL
jgi:hypothetical protein